LIAGLVCLRRNDAAMPAIEALSSGLGPAVVATTMDGPPFV
jgi:hypothetical protein